MAVDVFGVAICLILAVHHLRSLKKFRTQRLWLTAMLLCNVGMMLGDLSDWLCNGVRAVWAVRLAPLGMCAFYAFSGLLLLSLTGYLLAALPLRTRRIGLLWRAAMTLALLQAALSVLSLPFGLYFYYTADNVYVRGPLFFCSQGLPLLLFFLNTVLLYLGRARLGVRMGPFLAGYILLPVAAQLLQALFYGGAYLSAASTIALLLVNISVQRSLEESAEAAERELADLQFELMMSQIKPHFLYNSLTVIRQLCDIDPAQAKRSLLDFSRFLRANMHSLDEKKPIPFARELEHAQSYLNLERQRFGDKLRVVWEIETDRFCLPTLTLQPLVENAVRHGVRRREEGGCVRIRAQERQDGFLVSVADDGPGMERGQGKQTMSAAAEAAGEQPQTKDAAGAAWGRSQRNLASAGITGTQENAAAGTPRVGIGIANVRRRLELQCGGTMTVKSSSQGTKVTLWVPK